MLSHRGKGKEGTSGATGKWELIRNTKWALLGQWHHLPWDSAPKPATHPASEASISGGRSPGSLDKKTDSPGNGCGSMCQITVCGLVFQVLRNVMA